jgi:hypothetical protein
MNDKPATTYIVSVFDKPHWRTRCLPRRTKPRPKPWRKRSARALGSQAGDARCGGTISGQVLPRPPVRWRQRSVVSVPRLGGELPKSRCFSKMASLSGSPIRTLARHLLHLKPEIALTHDPFLMIGREQLGHSNLRSASSNSSVIGMAPNLHAGADARRCWSSGHPWRSAQTVPLSSS